MVSLNVLGLNCGTSIDGIDVAHCLITSQADGPDLDLRLIDYREVPVTPSLRTRILSLVKPSAPTTLADICDLNFALGEEFARAIKESGIDLEDIDIVASHGSTLWHNPVGERTSTLQMAEPAIIAQRTGKTVVSNFRTGELASRRQGAPLSGFFEAAILAHPDLTRISQNIGGIGNASAVPATNGPGPAVLNSSYFAFDTGPGNVLIDAAVRLLSGATAHYDKDGEAGKRGEGSIDDAFVDEFLARDYFQKDPPKTTGRELFSDDLAREIVVSLSARNLSHDGIIATITRITSESIVRAYEKYVIPVVGHIDEVYVCGGGAFNPNILEHISARLPHTRVAKMEKEALGVSAEAKEAVLFAVLGFLGVCGRSVPVAGLAESREAVILGTITPGKNYRKILEMVVSGRTESLGRIFIKTGLELERSEEWAPLEN